MALRNIFGKPIGMENNIQFYDVACMRIHLYIFNMYAEFILIAGLFNSNRQALTNVRTFDKKWHIYKRHSLFIFLVCRFLFENCVLYIRFNVIRCVALQFCLELKDSRFTLLKYNTFIGAKIRNIFWLTWFFRKRQYFE